MNLGCAAIVLTVIILLIVGSVSIDKYIKDKDRQKLKCHVISKPRSGVINQYILYCENSDRGGERTYNSPRTYRVGDRLVLYDRCRRGEAYRPRNRAHSSGL